MMMATKKSKPEVKPQPAAEPLTPVPAAAEAKPETAPQAATVVTAPSKQDAVLAQLREAWRARGVDLSHLITSIEGKTMKVLVGDEWPLIAIGNSGGITLPTIRSYARAFDAAVEGDKLFAKQNERDTKRTNGTTATPKSIETQISELEKLKSDVESKLAKLKQQAATATPPAAEAKPESTTAKKKAQHDQIEKQMA
jgi:hypothetical protein